MRNPRPNTWVGISVCGLALLMAVCGTSLAALVVSEPAAGSDELPPQAPTDIRAADVPDDDGGRIQLFWILSPDDRAFPGGLAISGDLSTYGAIATRGGINGYRIYRSTKVGVFVRVGEVAAGTDSFVDSSAVTNELYVFEVRSFDSNHETAPAIEAATEADIARTARAENNDFFLFADRFGRIEGELTYDPRFDLNGNQRIDFADFFIFADHFGRTVANFDQPTRLAE